MEYKAIFFDRDGTLTYFDKEKELWRDQIISQWSDKPFELSYDKMMSLFNLALSISRALAASAYVRGLKSLK